MDEERKVVLLPPTDIDAEKAVLGSMLKSQDARADAAAVLRADDFYLKEHQEIYNTMLDMERRGTGIDITTVYSALKQRKTADMVGGMTYLSRLMDEAIVPSNARYYADTVCDKSKMRQLINEAEAIRDSAYSAELPPEDAPSRGYSRSLTSRSVQATCLSTRSSWKISASCKNLKRTVPAAGSRPDSGT